MSNSDDFDLLRFGASLREARGAVLLLHGRGSSAQQIAGLGRTLKAPGVAFIAPTAPDGTWYPQRFLAPLAENEPAIIRALGLMHDLVQETHAAGIPFERIGEMGFSQGACLSLEYAMRFPRRYGFVAGLSGALMGPLGTARAAADLAQTSVLLACAENDGHIPLAFVEQTAVALGAAQATVTKQLFAGSTHGVFPEEIAWLRTAVADWR